MGTNREVHKVGVQKEKEKGDSIDFSRKQKLLYELQVSDQMRKIQVAQQKQQQAEEEERRRIKENLLKQLSEQKATKKFELNEGSFGQK